MTHPAAGKGAAGSLRSGRASAERDDGAIELTGTVFQSAVSMSLSQTPRVRNASEAANREGPSRNKARPNRRKLFSPCVFSRFGSPAGLRPSAGAHPGRFAVARFQAQLNQRGPDHSHWKVLEVRADIRLGLV